MTRRDPTRPLSVISAAVLVLLWLAVPLCMGPTIATAGYHYDAVGKGRRPHPTCNCDQPLLSAWVVTRAD